MDIPTASSSGILFFDLETTVPSRSRPRFSVLEFGAIVVCPRKLEELESYTTLIRPNDISFMTATSGQSGGITRDAVAGAPSFAEVSDTIFNMMNGRIWAGHNIQRFDCIRIREAFAEIGQPPPVPAGIIDSLDILTRKFGRRAGNMKMASLASYFGLGKQKHRSLDDARMNLEVLKHCATVLFLESSLPCLMDHPHQIESRRTTRSITNTRFHRLEGSRKVSPPATLGCHRSVPCKKESLTKMRQGVQMFLSGAQRNRPFSTILRHSHSLVR